MTNLILSRRESISFLAVGLLKEKLDRSVDIGISLATRVRFCQLLSEGKWDEAIKILESVLKDFPFVERIFLTDSGRILLADTPELPGVRGKNFSFRDWDKGISKNW